MKKKSLNSRLLSLLLAGASLPMGALAQGLTVSGHVQDTTGEAVPFATVTVPGTKAMTQTDANGNFKINVKPGANIHVAYIGYKPATIKADGTVVITLEDNSTLNEAVVIGYGVAKKICLTALALVIQSRRVRSRRLTSIVTRVVSTSHRPSCKTTSRST